ncbi:MAG: transporter substrate-binding domain-containing protein [Treponema sp.]|jgi:L-cystine transport system substrate-binding protein|nr:transporter substrate-binding domain-containing protein [Treponema sp.]
MKKIRAARTPPGKGVVIMKKFLVKAVFVMLAAALVFSCAKKSGKIIIGTGQSYEPFCYRDSDGNLAGFDIEVVKEIGRRLPQYTFEFEVFEFKNVLVSLASGKIDVGAHEFEENSERRETYLYGEEGYNDFNNYLVVKADGPWGHVSSIEELAGNPDATIVCSTGANDEAFLVTWNRTHPADKQLKYASFDDDYARNTSVANGTNAALLITRFDTETFNIRIPGLNFKVATKDPVTVSEAYFLFKKNDATLQQAFDGALRDMKADGTLDRIRDQVFTGYINSLEQEF